MHRVVSRAGLRPALRVVLVVLWAAHGGACPAGGAAGPDGIQRADGDGGSDVPAGGDAELRDLGPGDQPGGEADQTAGFSTHDRLAFGDVAEVLAFAGPSQHPAEIKFVITQFTDPAARAYFQDPTFYDMHDEWFWFRLANGVSVPGIDAYPPAQGYRFQTVDEVVAHCADVRREPCASLDLYLSGGRLYSPYFYDQAMCMGGEWQAAGGAPGCGARRAMGAGTLLHYPPDVNRPVPDEIWAFSLEYQDMVSAAEVARFIERLEAQLPAPIPGQLRWLARSPDQADLALAIRAGAGPLAERMLTYADIVVPGSVEVYNDGIAAGYLRLLPTGAGAMLLAADDIPLLGALPDDLPPVAAIVSAVPQTPLAHINLLARSRGTPNVYIAGALDNPQLVSFATLHIPAAVWARSGDVRWRQLTSRASPPLGEWETYKNLRRARGLTVQQIDWSSAPYAIDLDTRDLTDLAELGPLVGGKSSGMAALRSAPPFERPDRPLAITIRAYAEHLAPLRADLASALSQVVMADARVRLLVVSGSAGFRAAYGSQAAADAFIEGFFNSSDIPQVLKNFVSQGGIRAVVAGLTIPPDTLAALTAALREQFADLSPEQGLRFRSSSTVEDIEGFNGAGLYESFTGFLEPEPGESRTVAEALRKTFASYWNYAAFEERGQAGIDHLSGNMGVLVHARFDDAAERANGVFTLTLRPAHWDLPALTVLDLNVQKGALSVTNPEGTGLPEVDRVEQTGTGEPAIVRVQRSSESPTADLLDDAQLRHLFDGAKPLAAAWLDQINEALPPGSGRLGLVLDFEFRWMAAGWPTLVGGPPRPSRLILKQVRTLERPGPAVTAEVAVLPLPRDLRAVAARVVERHCVTAAFELTAHEVYAQPGYEDLYPYTGVPFTARLAWAFGTALPELGIAAGTVVARDHPAFAALGHPQSAGQVWDLAVTLAEDDPAPFAAFHVQPDGAWRFVTAAGGEFVGTGAACTTSDLLLSPEAYLQSLFEP